MFGSSNNRSFRVPGRKETPRNAHVVDVASDDGEMPDCAASPEWTGLEFDATSDSDSNSDDVNDIPRELVLACESNRK